MAERLPICDVLPQVISALDGSGAAVLVAPPGAGKTTAVAPALLDRAWCDGQIILTSPRRVAARAAAERMAGNLGEKPGETVGYLTRLESRVSAKTRILVVTEAILVNRIVEDPELAGVSAVLFDEAHERRLDSDFGLALALESRDVLRKDLRLLVMSATIDGVRLAQLLGEDATVVESIGRTFPLRIEWLGSQPDLRIDDAMTDAVVRAWSNETGDILAFLPGVSEIERTGKRLKTRLADAVILPLHGQVRPSQQRAAIKRDPDGRRRIVLATAIAETSLTLNGVSVVVDSGLARRAQYDQTAGMSLLVTRRASQAAAAQRAGRAARQGPGIVYRLWDEHGHAGRHAFDPPEIKQADLTALVLALAKWGASDPASLPWLDPPPDKAVSAARSALFRIGALDDAGRITPRGRQIASLPLDPIGAATILSGAEVSQALDAAKLVLLLQERGLGGRSEDLMQRLARWDSDRGNRAENSRKLAQRWARAAERLVSSAESARRNPALFLALARPDFIARQRNRSGEHWLSAGGRGFQLDPLSPLAREEWLVIGDAQGRAKGAKIVAAAGLTKREVDSYLSDQVTKQSLISWNKDKNRVEALLESRLGAIVLKSGPDPHPDPDMLVDKLVEKAVEMLGELIPADLLARGKYAGLDDFGVRRLAQTAEIWLRPLLDGRRDLELPRGKLIDALLNQLDWNARRQLDRIAPREFASPARTNHPIEYSGVDAPSVEVRVQALFGLDQHPMIGATPLLIKLTSPAGRTIQATRDLPGFWRGNWVEVKKHMRGRYPKHRWPDEPWLEKPSLKTKSAFNRGAS